MQIYTVYTKSRVASGPTVINRVFKTNSSFHVKQHSAGKVKFLLFKGFLLVQTKFSFWQGEWALGYRSMEFSNFPDIS